MRALHQRERSTGLQTGDAYRAIAIFPPQVVQAHVTRLWSLCISHVRFHNDVSGEHPPQTGLAPRRMVPTVSNAPKDTWKQV